MARRRWSRPRKPRPAAGLPSLLHSYAPLPQVGRTVCDLCGRQAAGFGYLHQLRSGEFPHLRFCSMACCDVGGALAARSGGVIDKTAMEAQAIKDARRPFAEVLMELNLLAPFHGREAAEIDRIIEACVDGFQASMQRQAAKRDPLDHDIPF